MDLHPLPFYPSPTPLLFLSLFMLTNTPPPSQDHAWTGKRTQEFSARCPHSVGLCVLEVMDCE
jgi:hypothetical protein